MPPIYYLFLGFAFVFGAVVGSFLNVCIYRIPAGESVVSPRSRCPRCGSLIRWYQNIPILSWLFLRGRCANCRTRISPRYVLVEALTGLLFVLVLRDFGIHWATPVFWVFIALLVTITFIDLDHQIIPDVISLPGIVIGFGASFLLPWVSWSDSLLGILLGGGSLFLVAVGYEFLTKKEGMGGGDIKLLAMLGAFLGWKAVLPIIFVSSLLGTLVGVPLMLAKGSDGKLAIPFGPFLAAAAVIWLFWGEFLADWYLQRFL
ncbi:prepilin peptidase [Trichloromonas sp.]|uniref:prepilin peptidase n=1 Tax=Trichloromonas sp. TaxID=3069249 RepID=UPI002A38D07A|nr:prepilin peptidase [Trichloromonas sp.]